MYFMKKDGFNCELTTQQKLNLEELRIEHEKKERNQALNSLNHYSEQLNIIKVSAIWAIVGWILFVIPGLIASIVCFIKLLVYKRLNSNNDALRIIAAILIVATIVLGPIFAIIFVSKESEDLQII